MTSFKMESLKSFKYIFVLTSTHGDGEVPAGGKDFENWLVHETKQNTQSFQNIKYALFGLGDNSFPKFCGGARRIDDLMKKNGAERADDLLCTSNLGEYFDDYKGWAAKCFGML
jgi:sulfite reductase (NADPH) flavoprotein alpha-component